MPEMVACEQMVHPHCDMHCPKSTPSIPGCPRWHSCCQGHTGGCNSCELLLQAHLGWAGRGLDGRADISGLAPPGSAPPEAGAACLWASALLLGGAGRCCMSGALCWMPRGPDSLGFQFSTQLTPLTNSRTRTERPVGCGTLALWQTLELGHWNSRPPTAPPPGSLHELSIHPHPHPHSSCS